MSTPKVAVIGYASLDHMALLDRPARPGRTSTMLRRAESWPRLGGSPSYVAGALVRAGVAAAPITWVGDDPLGLSFADKLRAEGIATDGLATVAGAATPLAVLTYDPEGGCICLFDPGVPDADTLTPAQAAVLAGAEWLCVTIGPEGATRSALAQLRPDQKLLWVVKDDPRVLPDDLAAWLANRADVICHSRAEAEFVARVRGSTPVSPAQIVVTTAAEAGAELAWGDQRASVPAHALSITDPTGAGDSFAGGILAALIAGQSDGETIVRSGHKAAHDVLIARQDRKTGDET